MYPNQSLNTPQVFPGLLESRQIISMEISSMVTTVMTQPLEVKLEHQEYEQLSILPWVHYVINLPVQPLPSNADRPHMKTERLIVRPILPSDLNAFHSLRSIAATQNHSTARGRPDRDLEETRQSIENLQTEDQKHWYFGAFLQSTGELIGEGGITNFDNMWSGRPESDFLLKPEYWRQGYGTELWKAVTDSFWDLPRQKRRHQLSPAFMPPHVEPGDEVPEGVGYVWEDTNLVAKAFFEKMLKQSKVEVVGYYVDFDHREGRERNVVRWGGVLSGNPRSKLKGFKPASRKCSREV